MIYLNLKIKKLYFTLKYFLILVLFFLVSVFFVSKVSAQCVPWGYIQCGGNLGTDKCCADAPEGGGHFCVICDSSFLPGTLVKTSTGDKKIENIKVGDEVLSFKDKKIAYSKVVRVFKYPKPYHYTLEAGEYMVKVTYNHPFYIGSNQFKIVEELKIGDTVFVLENNQLTAKEITRKTRVEEESYVYNMTVDNTNTYFAGGFAVHNKGNFECNDRWVNCPAGYIRTNTVNNVECKADSGGTAAWCNGIGTAQAVTGCCSRMIRCEGEPDPEKNDCCRYGDDQITTYACVPIATPTPIPTNTPTPTPYPTVAISGNLREYLGAACYNNISTNTLSLNINPQIPAGVTANCGVTPPTGQTKSSYRCTVVFNNTSDPSQNLNLAALATGYSSAYWTNANACTNTAGNSLPIDVSSGGSTVYNKDIFFKNVSSWIKLKNSSFSGSGSLTNVLPLSIAAYDSDDDISQRYFIMNSTGNDPGLVTASSINTGTADVSSKNWKADYTQSTVMNPTAFLSYVKSRKTYTKITALNQITSDGIYVWDGVTSFPGITTATTPNFNFVLISTTQAITISGTDFSPGKSVALVANSITFGNSTQTANGLFIAQTIDAGSNSNQGLKITGNLIAKTTLTNNRSWSNNSKPSVFIVFDPVQYINLLPYLSTANYDWRQIQ